VANIASFLILMLYLYGRSLRFSNNLLHRKLMLVAFAADLVLVAALVLGRQALTKINPDMPFALQVHVPIAVITVILYFGAVISGFQLAAGKPVRRRLYWYDKFLTSFRILTFVTSVWVQFAH